MVAKSIAKNYTNIHKPTDYVPFSCIIAIYDHYWRQYKQA